MSIINLRAHNLFHNKEIIIMPRLVVKLAQWLQLKQQQQQQPKNQHRHNSKRIYQILQSREIYLKRRFLTSMEAITIHPQQLLVVIN